MRTVHLLVQVSGGDSQIILLIKVMTEIWKETSGKELT